MTKISAGFCVCGYNFFFQAKALNHIRVKHQNISPSIISFLGYSVALVVMNYSKIQEQITIGRGF